MEKWTVDDLGFISHEKHFFHKRDIYYVGCPTEETLTLHIKNIKLDITLKDSKELNEFFSWFCEHMRDSEKIYNENYYKHENYKDAILATQKSLMGKHIEPIK